MLITKKEELEKFYGKSRLWQGIPGIERTKSGKFFCTFYSGGITEQLGNYCALLQSTDEGKSWTEPIAAAYAGEQARCYDPVLWIDPLGRLWFCWAVMPNHRVWAAVCENPEASELIWSEPFKIGHDVMMNKPVALSTGEWLFPVPVWNTDVFVLKDKQSARG